MGLLLLQGASDLNPRELFASGEQGLWLDPSQMSTLYQDSNGVTPCTAAGDPVGLILDQSRGGLSQIGADLVTNGTFAADTDWTKGANWTIGSGVATKTGGAANNLTQTIGSTAAAWYRISLDVTRSAGTLTVSLGTSGTTYAITATGSYTFFILAGSGTQTLTLAGDSSFAGTVDNVVVRNVPGNHAYQTTSAARPTLARIPSSGRRNLLTRTEEFDNAAWTKTTATVTANQIAAPDGTTTADKIDFEASELSRVQQSVTAASEGRCYSIWLRTLSGSVSIRFGDAGNLQTITVTDSWQRFSATHTGINPNVTIRNESGGGIKTVYSWGAQLETGSTATNYQKVVATTDVTESGVGDLWHLVFDGSDDSLVTNSVDFTGTTSETRRNILSSTENFGSPWTNTVASATYNELGPEGRYNATTFTNIAAGGQTHIQNQIPYIPSQPYVLTFWIKAGTATTANVGVYANAAFLTTVGSVLSGPGSIFGGAPQTISGLSTLEWTKVQFTFTAPASGNLDLYFYGETSGVKTGKSQSIAQFQLELGSTPTAYQPTATDEMTVIAGVRKLDDVIGIVVELSASILANNGSFVFSNNTSGRHNFSSKGTVQVNAEPTINISTPPTTFVATGAADISGDYVGQRKNGVLIDDTLTDQGSGNYGNYPIYIGRRGGSSLPFNGHIYQLIVRGKTTPEGKLLEAERFVARKTGVTF